MYYRILLRRKWAGERSACPKLPCLPTAGSQTDYSNNFSHYHDHSMILMGIRFITWYTQTQVDPITNIPLKLRVQWFVLVWSCEWCRCCVSGCYAFGLVTRQHLLVPGLVEGDTHQKLYIWPILVTTYSGLDRKGLYILEKVLQLNHIVFKQYNELHIVCRKEHQEREQQFMEDKKRKKEDKRKRETSQKVFVILCMNELFWIVKL